MSVELRCADALDFLRSIPDGTVSLVATDPPYFGQVAEDWDNAWNSPEAFLAWMAELCVEWRRVLKANGSLYVFASPSMAFDVESVVRRSFRVLNHIAWKKVDTSYMAKKHDEFLRQYVETSERLLFAEHITADTLVGDLSGYYTAVTRLRRDVYRPIGDYFRKAREAAGLSTNDVEVALGYVERRDPSRGSRLSGRWEEGNALPTANTYERWRKLVGLNNAPREYSELRRWFDDELAPEFEQKRERFEHLRRPFAATLKTTHTDVWDFSPVPAYSGRHACEKPIAMMEHIVRTSSRPGDLVLDCFLGSGTTALAAQNLGRRFIGCDESAHWVEWTRQRLSQIGLSLDGAA